MTWWITNSTRLSSEKLSITELEATVDWLQVFRWQIRADLAMCVDFQVTNSDEEFAFQMVYPSVFPDTPPMVYTKDRTRVSLHQYGADGELCLEYRPDNWKPSVTGADMIVSCQKLLLEERPEQGKMLYARSAHVASLGRDMRSKHFRFLITEHDIKILNALNEREPISVFLSERSSTSVYISTLSYVGANEESALPSDFVFPEGSTNGVGLVVRLVGVGNLSASTADELRGLLESFELVDLCDSLLNSNSFTHLLIGDEEFWSFFCIFGEIDDRKVINYTTLRLPSEKQRLPDTRFSLSSKVVGLVGCGSIGSKIAASLCRSGVGSFFFIDEDIFFPGNVIRNELDLNDTGAHKAQALRGRLLRINPHVNIKALRIALGGQESADSMAGALESLGECDLLIDATAEPTAFNMIASVSTRQKKPMIWVEVFAGGIGGIVARARPDIDPIPLAARSQIEVWCNDQGVDWLRSEAESHYDSRDGEGEPLIAEDAEISIMAGYAARFASDILSRPEASIFPVSAYVVGFSSEWLFNEPFDTRPIDLIPDGEWGENIDILEPEALAQLIRECFPSEDS
tara:strand:+ start:1204 stop:2925 length:1722 start_codon:yes stop_codon:yes gene_type:complete